MPRANPKPEQIPTFASAAEKRAWLLQQLAAVEKEALLEDMAHSRNERITVHPAELRIEVGDAALYAGTEAAEFVEMLGRVVNALPLGTAFVTEAGRGGRVLSGGTSGDEGLVPDQPKAATTSRRLRSARARGGA